MLGHVLRSDCSSPAQRALQIAVDSLYSMKGHVGRHKSNLLRFIINDLNKRNLPLRDINDLYKLRATGVLPLTEYCGDNYFPHDLYTLFFFFFQKAVIFYGHLSVS